MKSITGTMFARSDALAINVPPGWRRKGRSSLIAYSLDEEFGSRRVLDLGESVVRAISSLPSSVPVEVALWLRPGPGVTPTEVSFDPSMLSATEFEAIWVEVERQGPGSEPDEVSLSAISANGVETLFGTISTSDADIRQKWLNTQIATSPLCDHVKVELRSRSGGAGIVLDGEVLHLLNARVARLTMSAVQEA